MGFFRNKKSDDSATVESTMSAVPTTNRYVELGSINYVNLTPDGRHGDMDVALRIARETGKPIFCNFVEWSG